jgi:hypothetical protein
MSDGDITFDLWPLSNGFRVPALPWNDLSQEARDIYWSICAPPDQSGMNDEEKQEMLECVRKRQVPPDPSEVREYIENWNALITATRQAFSRNMPPRPEAFNARAAHGVVMPDGSVWRIVFQVECVRDESVTAIYQSMPVLKNGGDADEE